MTDTDVVGAQPGDALSKRTNSELSQVKDSAQPPSDSSPSQKDRDSAAVKDTCHYITKVCQSFKAKLGTYDSETLRYVQEMNNQLKAILLDPEPSGTQPLNLKADMGDAVPGPSTVDDTRRVGNMPAPKHVTSESARRSVIGPRMIKRNVSTSPIRNRRRSAHCYARRDSLEGLHSVSDRSVSSRGYSDTSRDTSEEPEPSRRRARRRRARSSRGDVWRAISRLDTRSVPRPAVYDSA